MFPTAVVHLGSFHLGISPRSPSFNLVYFTSELSELFFFTSLISGFLFVFVPDPLPRWSLYVFHEAPKKYHG